MAHLLLYHMIMTTIKESAIREALAKNADHWMFTRIVARHGIAAVIATVGDARSILRDETIDAQLAGLAADEPVSIEEDGQDLTVR